MTTVTSFESSILAAVLCNKNLVGIAMKYLSSANFTQGSEGVEHATIWKLFISQFSQYSAVNLTGLQNLPDSDIRPEQRAYVAALYTMGVSQGAPTEAQFESWCLRLKKLSRLNSLYTIAQNVISQMSDFDHFGGALSNLDEFAGKIYHSLSASIMTDVEGPLHISDAVIDSRERIDKHYGGLEQFHIYPGLPSFASLIPKIGLTVLLAGSREGKTGLGLLLSVGTALTMVSDKQPGFVYIASMEMVKEDIIDRIICMLAGLDTWRLRTGLFTEDELRRYDQWVQVAAQLPIIVDDTTGITAKDIMMRVEAIANIQHMPPVMVMVDYAELVAVPANLGSREQEVAYTSNTLTYMAKQLQTSVLLLSQPSAKETSGRPTGTRYSAAIEHAATAEFALINPNVFATDSPAYERGYVHIEIRKQREGIGTGGKFEMLWRGPWPLDFKLQDADHAEGLYITASNPLMGRPSRDMDVVFDHLEAAVVSLGFNLDDFLPSIPTPAKIATVMDAVVEDEPPLWDFTETSDESEF